MMTKQELDYIFAPKSVAVVGVSSKTEGIQLGGGKFCKFPIKLWL